MSQIYEYFKKPRAGAATAVAEPPQSPILNDEDEKFLERLTSEDVAPPLPKRPVVHDGSTVAAINAQMALMDGAEKLPLPTTPSEEATEEAEAGPAGEGKGKGKAHEYLSFVRGIPAIITTKSSRLVHTRDKAMVGSVRTVDAAKGPANGTSEDTKEDQEEDTKEDTKEEDQEDQVDQENDLTAILDQLNLSAVNNRAFSFSETSQKMLSQFTQILKDIVNGVPTAYDDLEQFLKHWDEHLRKMYSDLPPFLQSLVKSLPAKMSSTIAPGLLAAASDKPGADAKTAGISTASGSKRQRIPSLKKLVGSQAAVTKMLQSILNFLKLRFPAILTGTNVLMSLAVFLLLFVFWYCHKRGRETRLERERLAAGDDDSDFEKTSSEMEESAVLENEAKIRRILHQEGA